MSDADPALVSHERTADGVDVVTLDNGKVNALSVAVLDRLHGVASDLAADRPRAVVVTGGPKVFAATTWCGRRSRPSSASRAVRPR